ncbi:hypothetical protein J2Y48_002678 [Mycoplana sp. BE70]|nr:hypothetical protein [Mycoplana sp. BE70]
MPIPIPISRLFVALLSHGSVMPELAPPVA